MCDPATMTAMTIAQGVAGVASSSQQARATNSAARKTYRSALESEAAQRVSMQRRYIEEAEGFNQQGYDLALQEAAARSSAVNSAASGGLTGPSMRALMAEQLRKGARNKARVRSSRDNATAALEADTRALRQQTQNRIDNTPTASYGLTDLLIQGAGTALQVAGIQNNANQQTDALATLAKGG